MELLRVGDRDALEALALSEPRTARHLLGRLWDPDPGRRELAACAIGASAAAHPELGLDLIRRLMWALNDESATNGVFAVPALAEIGARAPGLFAPFVAPLASFLWDDGLRLQILNALTRVAEREPRLLVAARAMVAAHASTTDPEEARLVARLLEQIRDESGETNGT